MYRRVGTPLLLVLGVSSGLTLLGLGSSFLARRAVDSLSTGQPAWLPPILPLGSWLTFLVIFAAVRMCALRGGSRRECILVGLSPLVPGAAFYVYLLSHFGVSALPTFAGFTSPVMSGELTLGGMVAARSYASGFLGFAAVCITATWLYLWVGRTPLSPPARPA